MNSPDTSKTPGAASDGRAPDQEARASSPQTKPLNDWYMPSWLRQFGAAVIVVLMVNLLFWPMTAVMREGPRQSVSRSNLRQIGQASLIYASDHEDQFPVASDIWTYAEALANGGGLNDSSIWGTGSDPANVEALSHMSTVLTPDKKELTPEFRKLKPSWAIPAAKLTTSAPASTPIAWTRGLRLDGTWSPHSPYGTAGGHIVFMGGNVQWFPNLTESGHQLLSRDGTLTSNILDALPPGARISEYVPTEAEQIEWAKIRRIQEIKALIRPFVLPGIGAIFLLVLIMQTLRRKWPAWLLVLFVLCSMVLAIITPMAGRVRE
jgi:hypothetical protein